jgi:pyroglutamyl-peptidase
MPSARKRLRILVIGFGPFPGAPENPTGPLVRALARKRWPGATLKAHVFPTRYKAVDRALPRLLKDFKPDALIMFGLANRSRAIRVETLARNRISAHPDAGGFTPGPCAIETDAPRTLPVRAATGTLLRAAGAGELPARLSRSAGNYLCNYLLWHATRAARRPNGPSLAAFIHVPPLSKRVTMERLAVSGEAILLAAARSLRRH